MLLSHLFLSDLALLLIDELLHGHDFGSSRRVLIFEISRRRRPFRLIGPLLIATVLSHGGLGHLCSGALIRNRVVCVDASAAARTTFKIWILARFSFFWRVSAVFGVYFKMRAMLEVRLDWVLLMEEVGGFTISTKAASCVDDKVVNTFDKDCKSVQSTCIRAHVSICQNRDARPDPHARKLDLP